MTNPVGINDEKFCRRAADLFPNSSPANSGRINWRAAAGCPVHDQNGIGRFALRVFLGFPSVR